MARPDGDARAGGGVAAALDKVIRHEVGEAHALTHDQAVRRVADVWHLVDPMRFDLGLVVEGRDGERVAVEVWNCGYRRGVWS